MNNLINFNKYSNNKWIFLYGIRQIPYLLCQHNKVSEKRFQQFHWVVIITVI